ncbi:glycoside hydrolase family 3 protein [Pelagibacteraceae bacterium]|nr:glycoside hydrolase family 3 protein [Pelagibacteraceae bacterium]
MNRRAIIISISGTILTNKEKKIIIRYKPWGIILFKRNINSFQQTKKLINDIKKTIKDKKYPILIDEEGGSVCRLTNFVDNKVYSQKFFGDLFENNKKLASSLYINYIFSLCKVFRLLGININTVPVLDIFKINAHKIIGKRSYSKNKSTIKKLGKICIKNYQKNKISTVIKHIPGHGRSKSDSHFKLPKINVSEKKLNQIDFDCFKDSRSHFAMTAHIVYSNIDKKNVATQSKKIINNIIRKKLKFKGILISDDISMKSLKNDITINALRALNAGCNLTLYCAGKHNESLRLLKHMPLIDKFTIKKTSEFYKFLS